MDMYFILFAAMAVGAGIVTIIAIDALISAMGLLTVFIALAALYLHLHAPLVAIFQISIYAGAILVLVVFVIMLLMSPDEQLEKVQKNLQFKFMGAFLAACMIGIAVVGVRDIAERVSSVSLPENFGDPALFGKYFFGEYLLHFETASVLLLVALIGSIYLAKKKL